MKYKQISVLLPAGVLVSVWKNDDKTTFDGSIIPLTLQLDMPEPTSDATLAKLRDLVKKLGGELGSEKGADATVDGKCCLCRCDDKEVRKCQMSSDGQHCDHWHCGRI
jgi:hypothetical protein